MSTTPPPSNLADVLKLFETKGQLWGGY